MFFFQDMNLKFQDVNLLFKVVNMLLIFCSFLFQGNRSYSKITIYESFVLQDMKSEI